MKNLIVNHQNYLIISTLFKSESLKKTNAYILMDYSNKFVKNDIKTLDYLFENTYKRLEKDYITDKSSKICIKRNVYECIHKNRVRKSFGIFEKKWASMIVFTITRDNSLVCELNLSILDKSRISNISELLLHTNYIYFTQIWVISADSQIEICNEIEKIFKGEDIKFKVIIFIPYSHLQSNAYLFDEKDQTFIFKIMKLLCCWNQSLLFSFEGFKLTDIDINNLFDNINNNDIYLYKWKVCMNRPFESISIETRRSSLYITQCEILNEKECQSLISLSRFLVGLQRSRFSLQRVYFKFRGMYEMIKEWNKLILRRNRRYLYTFLIINLREAIDDIEFNSNSDILFKFLNQTITVSLPKYEQTIDLKRIKEFIIIYVSLRGRNILNSLTPSEISELVFRNCNYSKKLNVEDLEGCSWVLSDANLTPWETTIVLNVASLLSKVSIINSQLSLVRHRAFMIFLNFDCSRVSQLFIEQSSFSMKDVDDISNSKNVERNNFILNKYDWNHDSYWLFYLLWQCKLLETLKEIHVNQNDETFSLDLFKLISMYLSRNKNQSKLRVYYKSENINSEIEIDEDYYVNILNDKAIKRMAIVNSEVYFMVRFKGGMLYV